MKIKGFTLIELMVVIVVVGIILGIAIPSFRLMYIRNTINKGKALIQNVVIKAKSYAATGTSDWRIEFQVVGGEHSVSLGPIGGAITEVDTLPGGCTFSNPGIALTFEFYRDGTASSSAEDTFSIKRGNRKILFTLIKQIGEVKIK